MGRICLLGNKWKTLRACCLLECAGQDKGSHKVQIFIVTKRSKVILPKNKLTSQPQTTSTITTHIQKNDYLAGRKTKDEQQQCERVAQMSPRAQVSSCSIIKRLIAQSKIVKQYCMVVLSDMT